MILLILARHQINMGSSLMGNISCYIITDMFKGQDFLGNRQEQCLYLLDPLPKRHNYTLKAVHSGSRSTVPSHLNLSIPISLTLPHCRYLLLPLVSTLQFFEAVSRLSLAHASSPPSNILTPHSHRPYPCMPHERESLLSP